MIEWNSWPGTAIVLVLVLLGLGLVLIGGRAVLRLVGRRHDWLQRLFDQVFPRAGVLLAVIALWVACSFTEPGYAPWWPIVSHLFLVATILSAAWTLSGLTSFGFTQAIERFGDVDGDGDNLTPHMRRQRTQLIVLRRLVVVTITTIAIGAALSTFPDVRAVGASLLASAGVVGIIAALAAQSTLGNLIAGIQLAFSNAIRVGDVVVVEGEWGRIGEITLSYVVVNIWDERRLILPCTYFTSQPFESWTRKSERVLGTVFLDLDWRVPVDAVRAQFQEIIESTREWDRRTSSAVVTEAQGGFVTMRFLVSAANSGDLFTLRVVVREALVTWIQRAHPEALPVTRVRSEMVSPGDSSRAGTEDAERS